MKDRFTAGALAGFLAGLTAWLCEEAVVRILKFGETAFVYFGALVIFLHAPETNAEYAVGLLMHLTLSTIGGGVFAYFLTWTSRAFDLIKGVLYSVFLTWAVWAATFLVKTRPFASTPENSLENYLVAVIYGLLLALFYRHFRPKEVARKC